VEDARSLSLQPDGKIILGGSSLTVGELGVLARYKANGALDTTFGGDGRISHTSASYQGVSVQADGKIVAAAGPHGSIDRFNTDGLPDLGFGLDGRVSLLLGYASPSLNNVRDVVIQPDGKLLAAGSSDSDAPTQFALARLNPDGSFDAGDTASSMALDPASVDFLMSGDTTKR
jgi:uncharacterized delta-60 repeat protein